MNEDISRKIALLQLKEKEMKASGDVLTELSDMQALRQFSADLKALIDEQHAAGAVPANPLSALRESLVKVVASIKRFRAWQDEQRQELDPFLIANPKVSLAQINSMITALPPVAQKEKESIEEVISLCEAKEWFVEGNVIHLRPELEEVQEVLLPEFLDCCDGSNGFALKERLGADVESRLHRLAQQHQQQTATAADVDTLLTQGNYRMAKAKAREASLISADGKNRVVFTDIDFGKHLDDINKCQELVKNAEQHLGLRASSAKLHQAETMLKDAQGEFREDLSAAVRCLKASIAKAKKDAKRMTITVVSVIVVIGLAVSWAIYADHAAKKKEAAATEQEAEALIAGDYSNVLALFKKAVSLDKAKSDHTGWLRRKTTAGNTQLLQYQDGRANGIAIAIDNADRIVRISDYLEGQEIRTTKCNFYRDHSKRSETSFKGDVLDGPYAVWWKNGNKQKEGQYVDGEKHGPYTVWHENGIKRIEGTYKNGKWNGLVTEWNEDGQKTLETSYDEDGREEGVRTVWHKNGEKQSTTQYKNGIRHGLAIEWDESGRKIREANYLSPGSEGYSKALGKGYDSYRQAYANGDNNVGMEESSTAYTYHGNGKMKSETNHKYGKKHGPSRGWHENGKNNYEVNYNAGKCVSLTRIWDEDGNLVDQNHEEAAKYYRMASEQGLTDGHYNLGLLYHHGKGVSKDQEKSFAWFGKAAEQGHAGAQHALGLCYAKGEGVTKNYYAATKWFREAAEQGYAEAQFDLGFCYAEGKGIYLSDSKAMEKAIEWWQKAAAQGHAKAERNLEIMKSR